METRQALQNPLHTHVGADWRWRWRAYSDVVLTDSPPADVSLADPAVGRGGLLVVPNAGRGTDYGPADVEGLLVHISRLTLGRSRVVNRAGNVWSIPGCSIDASRKGPGRTGPDDDEVLAFVRRWGLLRMRAGWALWGENVALGDSVDHTRTALAELRELVLWLAAMRSKNWRSLDLPSRELVLRMIAGNIAGAEPITGMTVSASLRRTIETFAEWDQSATMMRLPPPQLKVPRRQWPTLFWFAFALAMNERLWRQRLRPLVDWDASQQALRAYIWPESLLDICYFTLWRTATQDGLTARTCQGCRGVFFVNVTNTKRLHCSTACGTIVRVARFRKRKRDDHAENKSQQPRARRRRPQRATAPKPRPSSRGKRKA